MIISVLPQLSFFTGLTVSSLHTGGRTFWEVLKEEKEFDLCKRNLDLNQVEFSYADSFYKNFSGILWNLIEPPSEIYIREIIIRLRQKEQKI